MTLLIFFFWTVFFIYFQSISIYGGDAGDLVTAAYVGGFAHPPGYPLYSFLGYLVTHLEYNTVAWRMSLLSSIPSALTLSILYSLLFRITKSKLASLFSASVLGSVYIFWLYSIVPEVFSVNNLFTIILIYLGYLWYKEKNLKYAYLTAFVFGLSLAHHHIIFFIVPALMYMFLKKRSILKVFTIKHYVISFLSLALGFSAYIWVYISALSVPKLYWNDPVTFSNFIKLFTRAQYGTFQSGIQIGRHIQSRLLQFPVIVEFYINDFTLIGLILAFAGMIYLFKYKRSLFWYFFLFFFFTGPVYFFYASYLFITSFDIGTLERFLLPSYISLSIFIAFGFLYTIKALTSFFNKLSLKNHIPKKRIQIYVSSIMLIFFLIPLLIFIKNYPKLSILKNDQTAENLGRDVLSTPEKDAILFLISDTILFDTQYVYFTENIRPDIKLIHLNKFLAGEESKRIKKYYPNVYIDSSKKYNNLLKDFILNNYDNHPIYSNKNAVVEIQNAYWIPEGLLYRFYLIDDLPSSKNIINRNKKAWNKYHDPLEGSLGKYHNLLQKNVLHFYINSRLEYGNLYYHNEKYKDAIEQYEKALDLDPIPDTYYNMSLSYNKMGKCEKAIESIKNGKKIDVTKGKYYYYTYITYSTCYEDDDKALYWKEKYENVSNEKTLLKEL